MSIAATIALWIFVALFAIITVVLLGAIAYALTKVTKMLNTMCAKADPVIVKVTDTLDSVQRVTMTVGEKADHIMSRGEAMSDSVSENVEKTAHVVQSAITTPLINLSSLLAGVSKGFSVWSHGAGNGKHGEADGKGSARVYTREEK